MISSSVIAKENVGHVESDSGFALKLLSIGPFFPVQVRPDDSGQLLLHWSPGNRPRHSGKRQAHMMRGRSLKVGMLGVGNKHPACPTCSSLC